MYDQLDRWVVQSEKLEELNKLFAQKDWSAFRTSAKTFLENYPRSRVVPQIRKMDSQAKKKIELPE